MGFTIRSSIKNPNKIIFGLLRAILFMDDNKTIEVNKNTILIKIERLTPYIDSLSSYSLPMANSAQADSINMNKNKLLILIQHKIS